MRTTSSTADFMEFAANSIFVMEPFFSPFDSQELMAIIFTPPELFNSAIAAQILTDPTSIPKILADTFNLYL